MPSAPGQVIPTRETNTSVLIQWAPPKEPNNLIGYYIDQCVKGSKDWTSANHKPRKSTKYVFNQTKACLSTAVMLMMWLCFCRFVVSGLTTGETYVFRVQAINELGLSDESQESAPLTVKAALSQYWHIFYHYYSRWCLWSIFVVIIIKIKIQYCLFSHTLCSLRHCIAELWRPFNGPKLEEASSLWRSRSQGVLCGQKTQWNHHVEGGSHPISQRKTV